MCGKTNPDCGCSTEEKALHAAAHPEDVVTDVLDILEELQTAPVVAAGNLDEATGLPTRWHAVLTVEGLRTTDHRLISPDALTWRQLPLPLCAQFSGVHGPGDTPPSPVVGSVDTITRDELTGQILGEGLFDLTLEDGQQAAQMCLNRTLRWGSIDLEVLSSQYVEVNSGGGDGRDILDILFDDDIMGPPTDWYDEVTEGRIAGYTMVPIPAFPQCVIAPIDVPLDIPEPMGTAPIVNEGMIASGVQIPVTPKASYFANPEFTELTAPTITADGRYFGHLAPWEECHIGFDNVCRVAPHSAKAYAYFRTGSVECDNGEIVQVGQVTYDTGHAGLSLKASDTTSHYDHTGSVAADVAVGEDEFGIWFAGALRPGLTDTDIRVVRAAPLSGDWRPIGGNLELVAALAVNVPGFPIVAAGKRNGQQVSLIAGGVKQRDPLKEMAREIAVLRQAIRPLMNQTVIELKKRVHPQTPEKRAMIASLRERVDAQAAN